ncbi:hypothetical protein SDC9_94489 [bioreactor metagenome]|uniref:Uncharacterized protein n=1 Tax=bioreactor metagenome TaxID=1076179 RepID=A0A645AAC2_9ZZZZ
MGKVNAAAHGHAVDRGNQADDKQHSVFHIRFRQLAGHKQIQKAKVLHKHVERGDHQQKPSGARRVSALLPAARSHLIPKLLNDCGKLLNGDNIRVVGDCRRSGGVAYIRLLNARSASQLFFNFILAVHARHAVDMQFFGFDPCVHITPSFHPWAKA